MPAGLVAVWPAQAWDPNLRRAQISGRRDINAAEKEFYRRHLRYKPKTHRCKMADVAIVLKITDPYLIL